MIKNIIFSVICTFLFVTIVYIVFNLTFIEGFCDSYKPLNDSTVQQLRGLPKDIGERSDDLYYISWKRKKEGCIVHGIWRFKNKPLIIKYSITMDDGNRYPVYRFTEACKVIDRLYERQTKYAID